MGASSGEAPLCERTHTLFGLPTLACVSLQNRAILGQGGMAGQRTGVGQCAGGTVMLPSLWVCLGLRASLVGGHSLDISIRLRSCTLSGAALQNGLETATTSEWSSPCDHQTLLVHFCWPMHSFISGPHSMD